MRRWLLRISLVLLALLVVVIIVVQIVLSTNLPKRIVINEVQKQLGLRIQAESVSTGWFGETSLKNVTAALPLQDDAFLTMPELEVSHTWLPKLVMTRSIEIHALELKDPSLVIQQDPVTGRWNLQEAIELIARTGGKEQAAAQQAGKPGRPRLPSVEVRNATVTIIDRHGKTATLTPVDFAGMPDETAPALVYHYELTSGTMLNATGQLLPGAAWNHEVTFGINNPGQLLKPWVGNVQPLIARGHWQGQAAGGAVTGRLTLEEAKLLSYGAVGTVTITAGPGVSAVVKPETVVITTAQRLLPEAKVVGGRLGYDDGTIRAEALTLQAMGGVAEASGSYALSSKAGELSAHWVDIGPTELDIRQSGSFKATLRNAFPGNPEVHAELTSSGDVKNIGQWQTELTLDGSGPAWNQTDWKLAVSTLKWDGKFRPVDLKQLTADFQVREKSIRLTEMHLAEGGEVHGTGSIDLASTANTWSLDLRGNGWPVPRLKESVFEFDASAGGTLEPLYVDIKKLSARSGEGQLTATGQYDAQKPKPVNLEVEFSHRPQLQVADEADVLRGLVTGKGQITGTLYNTANAPASVELAFKLHGQELAFKDRRLGDMDIEIGGVANYSEVTIKSKELDLLGGRWTLGGVWKRRATQNPDEDVMQLSIGMRDLPLGQIGEAVTGRNDITGVAQGDFELVLPALQRPRLTGAGTFTADTVKIGDAFTADSAKGTLKLDGDQITLSPLELTHDEGKATLTASASLRQIKQPTVTVQATQWAVDVPKQQSRFVIDGQTELALDLQKFTATGPLNADVDITYAGGPLGTAHLEAEIAQRTLKVNTLQADAFGGTINGAGTLSADAPLGSAGTFTWRDINAAEVARVIPEQKLDGLGGQFGGTLKIAPSVDPRALGELRVDLVLDSYGGNFRNAEIGDATLTAFLGSDGQTADGTPKYRFVLSDTTEDPSLIRLADGVVRVWGRVSRHSAGATTAQLVLNLDRLDVNQLVHAVNPMEDKEHIARLSGKMTFVGPVDDLQRVFGTGSLQLVESDLVNVPFIRELYSLANVKFGKREPNGEGSFDLQLDAARLGLTNFRYFNRGVQVRAELQVADLWAGMESPLDGSAIASLRPLKDVKLPFFSDVDAVFDALQSQLGLQSVLISGTVGDQKVRPALLSEVGGGLRALIVGEAQSQRD